MSHRRKRNLAAKRPEPRDNLDAILANPWVRRRAQGLGDILRFNTRWVLGIGAAFALFQVVSPWTNSVVEKLPFLGFGLLCVGLFIAHRRYIR